MDVSVESVALKGQVKAFATENRGLTPEECTELCMRRLLIIADTAPPALRAQALEFKQAMHSHILMWMKQAVQSDRTSIAARLRGLGHNELADHINDL